MDDQVDAFMAESLPLVGQEARDVGQGVVVADWIAIKRFCTAIGDVNPLFTDPTYSGNTRYFSLIAPPTFVLAVRTPNSIGAGVEHDYGAVYLQARAHFEWVDYIRLGDRLESELRITGVGEGAGWKGRRTAVLQSTATYQNSYGGIIGTARGDVTAFPYDGSDGEWILERDVHRYSPEEIARIEEDLNDEAPPRGPKPLYWEEVYPGDRLPHLVKGPLTLSDLTAWVIAEAKPLCMGAPAYFDLKTNPGLIRTNPSTKWPYWDATQDSEDVMSCRNSGFRAPFGRGLMRVALAGHLITNWMGDEGFLRSLTIELPNHYIYGDTMWLRGVVLEKQQRAVGGAEYGAVDIEIEGTNQLEQIILEGRATVFLPSRGHPVHLPIPP